MLATNELNSAISLEGRDRQDSAAHTVPDILLNSVWECFKLRERWR